MALLDANDPARVKGLAAPARRLLGEAAQAIAARRLDGADRAFIGVLASAPRHPEVLRLLGVLRHLQGRAGEAVGILRDALAQRPDDALLHMNLGSALRASGDATGAIDSLRRASMLAPESASAWFNLGRALKSQSRLDEAHVALRSALERDPRHGPVRIALAETLKGLGHIDEAEAMYREATRMPKVAAEAWYGLANLKTVRFDAADASAMHAAMAHAVDDARRVDLGFALARAHEDAGAYAESFAALTAANALHRRRIRWDRAAFSARISAMLAADDALPPPSPVERGRELIFIVSLPRTGSTLAEQILGSHSFVEGAGELRDLPAVLAEESARRNAPVAAWLATATPEDWARMGEDYLQRTARWRGDKPMSTDKGLDTWHHLTAAVRMFPAARFVVCVRDPLETVFACYRQHFPQGQDFASDPVELVAYWHDFRRVATHFGTKYPSFHVHALETLQHHAEQATRDLLSACRLPFEAHCLRFHESTRHVRTASAAQVRQPLQPDTARAPLYGALLAPLQDLLHLADRDGSS